MVFSSKRLLKDKLIEGIGIFAGAYLMVYIFYIYSGWKQNRKVEFSENDLNEIMKNDSSTKLLASESESLECLETIPRGGEKKFLGNLNKLTTDALKAKKSMRIPPVSPFMKMIGVALATTTTVASIYGSGSIPLIKAMANVEGVSIIKLFNAFKELQKIDNWNQLVRYNQQNSPFLIDFFSRYDIDISKVGSLTFILLNKLIYGYGNTLWLPPLYFCSLVFYFILALIDFRIMSFVSISSVWFLKSVKTLPSPFPQDIIRGLTFLLIKFAAIKGLPNTPLDQILPPSQFVAPVVQHLPPNYPPVYRTPRSQYWDENRGPNYEYPYEQAPIPEFIESSEPPTLESEPSYYYPIDKNQPSPSDRPTIELPPTHASTREELKPIQYNGNWKGENLIEYKETEGEGN